MSTFSHSPTKRTSTCGLANSRPGDGRRLRRRRADDVRNSYRKNCIYNSLRVEAAWAIQNRSCFDDHQGSRPSCTKSADELMAATSRTGSKPNLSSAKEASWQLEPQVSLRFLSLSRWQPLSITGVAAKSEDRVTLEVWRDPRRVSHL